MSNPQRQPLTGIRVLDFSGRLGAYCTKLLADIGADVLKVEPPAGDPLRFEPPFKGNKPHSDGSLYFAYYHANKRGLTLDLASEDNLSVLRRLAGTADVVVISPGQIESGDGLDSSHSEWTGPDQVVCSVTPYGLTGPYRNYRSTHLTSHAMGGLMLGQGPPEGPPVVIPAQQMFDLAGAHAALCVLVALRNRPVAGGQLIDISAHEVMATQNHLIQRYGLAGIVEKRAGGPPIPPAGTWEVRDGLVELQVWTPGHWASFFELIGKPPELSDPRFADRLYRIANAQLIRDVVRPILAAASKADLPDRAQALKVPCSAVNSPGDFTKDAQPRSREFFIELDHPYLGRYVTPGAPFKTSEPWWKESRPAPKLGQHNRDVFVNELGLSEAELGIDLQVANV